MNILVFNIATGAIAKSVCCQDGNEDSQTEDGQAWIEHDPVDNGKFYVNDGDVIQRPQLQEVVSGTIISNLPNPTTVWVRCDQYEVNDGVAELQFSLPGIYSVRLVSFPYQEKTVEVTQS